MVGSEEEPVWEEKTSIAINVGMGSLDDYRPFVSAGADKVFFGYVPEAWRLTFGPDVPLNRRESLSYNVQIGGRSDLMILADLVKKLRVPSYAVINAPYYPAEAYGFITAMVRDMATLGFRDYIVADPTLIRVLSDLSETLISENKGGIRLTVSGELGELNRYVIAALAHPAVKGYIFPRQTTLEEMAAMTRAYPKLSFEAFLLNEKCHFTGAYCASLHCDELAPLCRVPYRVDASLHNSNSREVKSVTMKLTGAAADISEDASEDMEADALAENAADTVGYSGCGLCQLWKMREIGIKTVKIVSRGDDSESTVAAIEAVKRSRAIMARSESEDVFLEKMKTALFPKGCRRNCYYQRNEKSKRR